MKQRMITGLIATCILIPVLIFSETPVLPIGIALCALLSIFEMMRCQGIEKEWVLGAPVYLAAAGFPFLVRYLSVNPFRSLQNIFGTLMGILVLFLLYFFAVSVFSHGKYPIATVCMHFATSFYILLGFNAIMLMHDCGSGGRLTYLMIFIGAWITDIFAYFCGMLFGRGGKHKLIPDVSPKKTVEGSIGGIVFCEICMIAFGLILGAVGGKTPNMLIFVVGGVLASVVAQVGDLLMSVIKRTYGIKDYGKIFPGHGGMLDRFDSVLAVSLVLAILDGYLSFFEVI